ncbi:double zinc ribbon domain-containing protein [Albirhodobacter sp. R86504]|uniref:double zinc ribbon domain-containing protein n=1 Tax=Albirhodobacter sp. R86504 TaxID=3093848 RepID=UPI00366C4C72
MLTAPLERISYHALNAIFPPRCACCEEFVIKDGGLCASCWGQTDFIRGFFCDCCALPLAGEADGGRTLCDDCHANPPPWQRGRAVFVYKGKGRDMVLALKNDRYALAKPLARWLTSAVAPIIDAQTLVVPVPLHRKRLFERRYNQSALLSARLAKARALEHIPDLLRRPNATQSQGGKTAEQREANLKGAIEITPRHAHRINGRDILIVDDVLTSGATLRASAHACLNAGARKVSVAVLARVARDA